MNVSQNVVFQFLFDKVRNAFIVGLVISIGIFIFFGKIGLPQYWFGLLIGIINFALLTIGLDMMLQLKPLTVRILHLGFFILRYFAIALVVVLYIVHRNANVFIVVGGLLTMQISLFAAEVKKHLSSRKEG